MKFLLDSACYEACWFIFKELLKKKCMIYAIKYSTHSFFKLQVGSTTFREKKITGIHIYTLFKLIASGSSAQCRPMPEL